MLRLFLELTEIQFPATEKNNNQFLSELRPSKLIYILSDAPYLNYEAIIFTEQISDANEITRSECALL